MYEIATPDDWVRPIYGFEAGRIYGAQGDDGKYAFTAWYRPVGPQAAIVGGVVKFSDAMWSAIARGLYDRGLRTLYYERKAGRHPGWREVTLKPGGQSNVRRIDHDPREQ